MSITFYKSMFALLKLSNSTEITGTTLKNSIHFKDTDNPWQSGLQCRNYQHSIICVNVKFYNQVYNLLLIHVCTIKVFQFYRNRWRLWSLSLDICISPLCWV